MGQVNVEGELCDRCKKGFFNLQQDDPDGCSPCFCFDRSGNCVSSDLGVAKVTIMHYNYELIV